ncbi:hypothetical protein SAMN05216598_3991 [Pseudomonas asplenii]|uniref:MoxR-vWA-beta-propeller ternary system domain-containing protein n=1 Tax=Pseudomonas asplenii TaxID=53407 RepID=A0A1H1XNJ4_9PSED|nr:hypothetical protein [Pseudomonas asplenii]SDT10763.1 hypothetical protein SAMN05216598_3991 [Pseudomonas asplenii]
MSPSNPLSWGWKAQPEPTAPVAAVAWGAVARDLHARLASMGAERLRGLQATANRDVLIVSGESSRLPWVAGVEYACACEQAPQLWLPSLWQPDVTMDLLAQALQAKFARQPLLVWHQPTTCVPLDRLLPVTAELLARIAAFWR